MAKTAGKSSVMKCAKDPLKMKKYLRKKLIDFMNNDSIADFESTQKSSEM